jgi:hypothetical protein
MGGTFAVGPVISEIDSRLSALKLKADRGLRAAEADGQFVDLLATVELVNRYAESELLSGSGPQTGKGAAATRSLSDVAITHLKEWVARIREVLDKLAKALHASGWMVSVGFPWAVSISVVFDIKP